MTLFVITGTSLCLNQPQRFHVRRGKSKFSLPKGYGVFTTLYITTLKTVQYHQQKNPMLDWDVKPSRTAQVYVHHPGQDTQERGDHQ